MSAARAGRPGAGIASGGRRGLSLALAAALCAVAGCLDDELDPLQAMPGGTFIALQRDFQSFTGWSRVQVGDAEIVGGHPAGPRFAYTRGVPAGGSFPVGTIIVKTVEVGDPSTWTIHARAKRGGSFNPQGAVGWEWFELRLNTAGQTTIVWQGAKPPADHGYESLPGLGATSSTDADCNSCHGLARDADYILAPPLRAELGS